MTQSRRVPALESYRIQRSYFVDRASKEFKVPVDLLLAELGSRPWSVTDAVVASTQLTLKGTNKPPF